MTHNNVQYLRKLSAALTAASLLVTAPALAGNRDGFGPEELPWSPRQDGVASAERKQAEPESAPAMAKLERPASVKEKLDAMLDEGSGGSGFATSDSATPQESGPFDRSMDAGG